LIDDPSALVPRGRIGRARRTPHGAEVRIGEQGEDREHPDDHGACRQIERRREHQAQSVARDADSPRGGESMAHHSPRRERRDDEGCEHEIKADQLHRHGDGEREQHVEAGASQTVPKPEPGEQHQRIDDRRPAERLPLHPQNLVSRSAPAIAAVSAATCTAPCGSNPSWSASRTPQPAICAIATERLMG